MTRSHALALAWALSALGGCRPAQAPRPAAEPALGASADLAEIVSRARRSFRALDHGEHEATGEGWRARASPDGALAFTPGDGARSTSTALVLSAPRLSRGGTALETRAGPIRVDPEGALVRGRGSAVERLAGSERGLTLSWTFEARPEGTGTLAVRLPAAGLPLLTSSASGLHFGTRGGPLVRMGAAAWVDAAGQRAQAQARWTGAEVAFEVPSATVEDSTYPAALIPVLSPEAALDIPILEGAPGRQTEPAVATDGTSWLVAWTDRRSREETWVVATRVSADGMPLDRAGLVIASGAGERFAPAIAWGGGVYFVAWQERDGTRGSRLRGCRLGTDGVRLDAVPFDLGSKTEPAGRTAVAFDGSDFRVAWSTFEEDLGSTSGSCSFDLARFDPVGLGVSASQIGRAYCRGIPPLSLDCSGEDCFAAWSHRFGLGGGLFDRSGALRPDSAIRSSKFASGSSPAVARVGTGYVMAFLQSNASSDRPDLVGARVGADGAIDSTPFPIALQVAQGHPSLDFDGVHLVVTWESRGAEGSDVYALRLLPDGTPVDTRALPVAVAPGDQRSPAVAASRGSAFVAFTDTRSDPEGDLYGARVLPGDLPDAEGVLLSRAARRESRPAVGFDGARWLVAFEDERSGRATGIYGLRLAADLTPLDSAPFAIADGVDAELRPAVAGCAGGFLVAWEDYRSGGADVYLKPIPADGPPGPELAVATGPGGQLAPALACGEGGAALAWFDEGSWGVRDRALRAVRLSGAGELRDASALALSGTSASAPLSVAARADGFGVTWQAIDPAGHAVVFAARLGLSGGPGAPVVVCDAPGARGHVAISADAAGYQVFFADQRSAPARLRTARLSPEGELLDFCGVEIPGTEGGETPAAAFDGARHFVAFGRSTDGGGLRGASIAPGGGSLGAFELSSEPGSRRAPRAACDGRGRCLAVFEAWDASAGNGRARLRLLTAPSPAAGCRAAGECASGFCVDGVCCDSACGGGDPSDCLACAVSAGASSDGVCAWVAPGGLCRGGTACDAAERCDGAGADCPADALQADGAFCDDGNLCTKVDACLAGACHGTEPVQCSQRVCRQSVCNSGTGSCEDTALPRGTACDDGDPCTVDEQCDGSVTCRGSPKVCPRSECHESFCNAYTGECGERALADGTACNDGSACTVSDRCVGGSCRPGPAVRCPPPDACHSEGLCDRSSGACAYIAIADGSGCDDGDLCTRSSTCVAGLCVGLDPVRCPNADACHEAGACDPSTGHCDPPIAKADGTACDDGNACTRVDACRSGMCAGSDPVECPPGDSCQEAGLCNPATGKCASAWKPSGTACDDGNACTRVDACRSGVCVGVDPVECPPANPCQEAGLCNPATGRCASVWKPLGTPCDDGDLCTRGEACADGECRPGEPVVCPLPEDPCLEASCSRETGECGARPTPDGRACPGGQCLGGACAASASPRGGCGCGTGGDAGLSPLFLAAVLSVAKVRRRLGFGAAAR